MEIAKAVITSARMDQRTLPLQRLIDIDGAEKSVLCIIVEEVIRAGVEEICIVVQPGDEIAYREVAGDHASRLHFVSQAESLGYGHAVYCARDFVGGDSFLHLVGDHLYIRKAETGCAQHIVEVAQAEACAVSGVQATRENLLPYFGVASGRRIAGRPELYRIEKVVEKPTPTEAEQHLIVPGLRAGHYLCFSGMHVLTPAVIDILAEQRDQAGNWAGITLSDALAELAAREQYLALERADWRYNLGIKYGLLTAQLALALSGKDREEVLSLLLEMLAQRELSADGIL